MLRRRLVYALDVGLLAAAIVVIATGLLVDRLDLNDFWPHRYAGYAVALLVAAHVVLHWRFFLRPPKRRRANRTAAPVRPEPAPLPTGAVAAGPAGDARPPARPPSRPSPAVARRVTRRRALTAVGTGAAGLAAGWYGRAAVAPSPFDGDDVGLFYHRESGIGIASTIRGLTDWGAAPTDEAVTGITQVPLAQPVSVPAMPLAQALAVRRSVRSYADRPLTLDELRWVLWAATGRSAGALRTAPSAGALYPVQTYVAIDRVDGLDPGLWQVDVPRDVLVQKRTGSFAGDVSLAGLSQDFLARAPAVVVVSGVFQRSRFKYHERHYRYITWEAGHLAQNVCLAAAAAGLGTCVVGSFVDGLLNDVLQVDGRTEAALGLIALGPR